MKVLFLRSLNPFYESTASGNRYSGIIKGLLANDVQVNLVVTGGYSCMNEYKSKGLLFKNTHLKVYYTTFIFNNSIWFRRFNKYVAKTILCKLNQYRLKHFFKQKYDFVFLTNDTDILTAYNKHINLLKCKSIIELNEFTDIYREHKLNYAQLKAAIKSEQIFFRAIKNIDCFAIMTKTLMEHYKKIAKPNANFLHFPMTVDIARFDVTKGNTKYSTPYIAYTGSFSNGKDGVDILIKAFKRIAERYSDIHLYLAGFYHKDVIDQKQLIKDYGLEKRIEYIGALNREDIPHFLCNAMLLVLPRPDSHQAQGGFPTKLGEYLATGNPVCVTSVGEIPDYLEDNISAFIAEPGNIDSFANAMDRVLSNYEEAKKIGAQGKIVAQTNFSINVQSKRLITFLNTCKS